MSLDFFNPISVFQTGLNEVGKMVSRISPLPGEYSTPSYVDTGAKEPVKEFLTNPIQYVQRSVATSITNTLSGVTAYTGSYAVGSILGFVAMVIFAAVAFKVLWDNKAFILGLLK